MEIIIWLITLIPCSLLFTGIGIYAWRREKPMWFWSGSTVREEEITDVKAYKAIVIIILVVIGSPVVKAKADQLMKKIRTGGSAERRQSA